MKKHIRVYPDGRWWWIDEIEKESGNNPESKYMDCLIDFPMNDLLVNEFVDTYLMQYFLEDE